MKWLPSFVGVVLLLGLGVLAMLFLQVRSLEGTERELRTSISSLEKEWSTHQERVALLERLPPPQILTPDNARREFSRLVDQMREAGLSVVDIAPPTRKAAAGPPTPLDTGGPAAGQPPSAPPFEEMVGYIGVSESRTLDAILPILRGIRDDPRLLRLNLGEVRAGPRRGDYTLKIEVVFAVTGGGQNER